MKNRRLTVVGAIALAAAIMVPVAAAAKPPQLKATFGAGLTFDIKKGKKLLTSGKSNAAITVKARKYRFVVKEDSTFHNYVLVNSKGKVIKGKRGKRNKKVSTSVPGTLKKPRTYVIKLKKGVVYELYCSPHRLAGMTVNITAK